MRFALVDQIGIPSELVRMREALEEWGRQVAVSWHIPAPSVRVSTGADLDRASECPIYLQKSIDVQGAAAYHDEDALGNQFIRCGLSAVPRQNILRDPLNKGESLLGLAQHEVGEAMVDPTADVWRQQPFRDHKTGRTYSLVCQESCDPVQEIADAMPLRDGTKVDRIAWVYPEWFDARRSQSRPVDSHGALSAPLTLAPGGYQIAAMVSGENNLFAEIVEHHELGLASWRGALKKRHGSRTQKRLDAFNKR